MTHHIPSKTDSDFENISDHVQFRWLRGGKAFEIKITSSHQEDIDAYIQANREALKAWNKKNRFYSVQDVSHKDLTITPYFKQQLEMFSKEMKAHGLEGDSVIILNDGIMGRVIQVYGRIFARSAKPITQHWVTGHDAGMRKLEQLLGN